MKYVKKREDHEPLSFIPIEEERGWFITALTVLHILVTIANVTQAIGLLFILPLAMLASPEEVANDEWLLVAGLTVNSILCIYAVYISRWSHLKFYILHATTMTASIFMLVKFWDKIWG